MLADLGWDFAVIPAEIDEEPLPGEAPSALVLRLARQKAEAVARQNEGAWVIAADTVVFLNGAILGKPKDRKEALGMLERLNGRIHEVYTGIALYALGALSSDFEKTRVKFRQMDFEALTAYVATGEGDDKAGAYAIQGKGALLVDWVQGCYFNVVGLPLRRLSALLEERGWRLSDQWRKER